METLHEDWENYETAGALVGTVWCNQEVDTFEVTSVRQNAERLDHEHRRHYPEIVVRFDPNEDDGDTRRHYYRVKELLRYIEADLEMTYSWTPGNERSEEFYFDYLGHNE